jgi:hypothetical protein
VAVGDSYASGEGAAVSDFLPGTNGLDTRPDTRGEATGCHRAANGYAAHLSRKFAADASPMSLVACSGARVPQLYGPNVGYSEAIGEYEPPQINAVDPASTRLATPSIGGNDSGFADVVQGCIAVPPTVDKNCRKSGGRPQAGRLAFATSAPRLLRRAQYRIFLAVITGSSLASRAPSPPGSSTD